MNAKSAICTAAILTVILLSACSDTDNQTQARLQKMETQLASQQSSLIVLSSKQSEFLAKLADAHNEFEVFRTQDNTLAELLEKQRQALVFVFQNMQEDYPTLPQVTNLETKLNILQYRVTAVQLRD
jgi:ABC-type enterochelin transport system substrate-binding protein